MNYNCQRPLVEEGRGSGRENLTDGKSLRRKDRRRCLIKPDQRRSRQLGIRPFLVGLGGGSGGAGVDLLDVLLRGQERGSDDSAVEQLGALCLGQHQPDDGQCLEGVVPGNVVQHNVDKGLEEREQAEDDPVGEPLDVILGRGALESLEREVGGDEEANQVGEESSGTVEDD